MPRRRLEVNAQALPDADTWQFGIADWLAPARADKGMRFQIAYRNCRRRTRGRSGRDAVLPYFSRADLPLRCVGKSYCSWLTVLNAKSCGVVIPCRLIWQSCEYPAERPILPGRFAVRRLRGFENRGENETVAQASLQVMQVPEAAKRERLLTIL